MSIEIESNVERLIKIKVIGIGGGGNNVINRMVKSGVQDIDFIAINTDIQALNASSATTKIQIGVKLTKGQGAGADPEKGEKSAIENKAQIEEVLQGTDMVFITAGMGGGTGTGAAPVVAEIAKGMGILTVGVVTKPFSYEGTVRKKKAEAGIRELQSRVDSLVVISNDRISECAPDGQKLTFFNGMAIADSVLEQAVVSVSDLIQKTGFINLDFADIAAVMRDGGRAHMGFGKATGDNRAEVAARMAIASPLMEYPLKGAKGFIINIAGSCDLGMEEAAIAMEILQAEAFEEAQIIYGASFDDELENEMRITVIATGFEEPVVTPPVVTPFTDAQKRAEEMINQAPPPEPVVPAFAPMDLEQTRQFPKIVPEPTPAPVAPAVKPVQQAPEPLKVPITVPGVPVTYSVPQVNTQPQPQTQAESQNADEYFGDIEKMFSKRD